MWMGFINVYFAIFIVLGIIQNTQLEKEIEE
jgi:hypothetical protein